MARSNSHVPKTKTLPTRHDLAPHVRADMIALLNEQLADTFDLYSQTKQAHRNVKGAEFYSLHLLFDKLAEQLGEFTDLIAERATALGGVAKGTVAVAAEATRIPELPVTPLGSLDAVEALAIRYAHLAATTRTAIDKATKQNDQDTADLFIEISRELDKSLWFLEAHLQA